MFILEILKKRSRSRFILLPAGPPGSSGTRAAHARASISKMAAYYLRRAFDGTDALSGCLFIGANSAPGGTNILIYGHEMKDGSMFGRLDAFADEDYARENSQITYDLIQPDGSYERLTFQVMAAFYSRIYQVDEENVFRYYYCTDLSDPEEYEYYVNQVMAASLYDLGVTAEYGDRLLTLSTCSGHIQDGRFVVVAREAAPGSFSQ